MKVQPGKAVKIMQTSKAIQADINKKNDIMVIFTCALQTTGEGQYQDAMLHPPPIPPTAQHPATLCYCIHQNLKMNR
ncbi:hypothetical protein E2C01_043314 [Portunus trituberculatus]|uniref:Uncharacterized protein n=1 Tax=Portunus trituberculatus TaxID=210409 RepID=A0A5B7FPZ6_PORTR|nr:hypothetical protein [Portunus trituberculatus]